MRRGNGASPAFFGPGKPLVKGSSNGRRYLPMKRTILGLLAPLSVVVTSVLVTACKKDEPPPPLPTAQPVAAAPVPLQLKPEDAGVKLPPADSGVKKKAVGHGGGSAGGLSACCAALQQNAMSAPPPTNAYMLQAAALCSALAAQGRDKAAVGGMLLGALKGAGMPTQCR